MKNIFHLKIQSMYGICYVAFAIFILVFFVSGIQTIRTQEIDYDAAYNAQVALRYLNEGVYGIYYPSPATFPNIITTGQTVILPTILLYHLFGVRMLTTGLTPLLYSTASLIILFFLLRLSFSSEKKPTILSTLFPIVIVILMPGSDYLFLSVSTQLWGESASLFYTILACLLLAVSLRVKHALMPLFFSGMALISALISKTSAICIVIVFLLSLFLASLLFRKLSLLSAPVCLAGCGVGFFLWESVKCVQLNGWENVLRWWINERLNAKAQTATEYLFGSISSELIKERFLWVSQFLYEKPAFMSFLLLTLPFFGVILLFILRKKNMDSADTLLPMVILGLCGVSLPIYYVFFGNIGLRYPRRQEAYVFLTLVFGFYIVFFLIRLFFMLCKTLTGSPRDLCVSGLTLCLVFLASNLMQSTVADNYRDWIKPKELSDEAYNMLMCAETVKQLPKDVVIFTHDYYQMPQISLLSNRQFVPFMSIEHPSEQPAYFLTGTEESPEGYASYLNWLAQFYDIQTIFQYPRKENDVFTETGNIYYLTPKKSKNGQVVYYHTRV